MKDFVIGYWKIEDYFKIEYLCENDDKEKSSFLQKNNVKLFYWNIGETLYQTKIKIGSYFYPTIYFNTQEIGMNVGITQGLDFLNSYTITHNKNKNIYGKNKILFINEDVFFDEDKFKREFVKEIESDFNNVVDVFPISVEDYYDLINKNWTYNIDNYFRQIIFKQIYKWKFVVCVLINKKKKNKIQKEKKDKTISL